MITGAPSGADLRSGFVLTVEPDSYFIPELKDASPTAWAIPSSKIPEAVKTISTQSTGRAANSQQQIANNN